MRASAVVKRQSTVQVAALRRSCQAATARERGGVGHAAVEALTAQHAERALGASGPAQKLHGCKRALTTFPIPFLIGKGGAWPETLYEGMALAVSVFALILGIAPEDKETTYETLRGAE